MKNCFKCGQRKSLDQFYRHAQMADGHLNKCIECARADALRVRSLKVDHYREYDRIRSGLEHRVAGRRAYHAQWKKQNPAKYAAHSKVSNAIRAGKLKKAPCEACGAVKGVHAHHDDYSKPLAVRWLCVAHHAQVHAEGAA